MADLALTDTFQKRVYERIRDSIGDLMSDEDLQRLVETAMQKAFFEPVKIEGNYYQQTRIEPPWFVAAIKELLKERVKEAVKVWIETHPDEIAKLLDEVIAKGFVGIVLSYFEQQIKQPLWEFTNKLQEKGLLER